MVTGGFLLMCVVIVIAPGPSFAVVLTQSIRHGRAAGVATVLGNTSGLVVWASASVLGLTALIRTSEVAFVVIKVLGAGYLCWLGLRALLRSRQKAEPAPAGPEGTALGATGLGAIADVDERGCTFLAAYRTGFLTNISNPKAAILYLALLPQFLPPNAHVPMDTIILAAAHMAISATWFSLVVLTVGLVRRRLSCPRARAVIERVSGLALVIIGVQVVTLSRAAL